MALLSIGDLDVFYGRAQALHGVSLEVEAGSIVAVVGPNGAGKSTLLDSIVGLTRRRGQITFADTDITRMSPARIIRLGIGYATERGNLFPFMGVRRTCSSAPIASAMRSRPTCAPCSTSSPGSRSGRSRRPRPSPAGSARWHRSAAR